MGRGPVVLAALVAVALSGCGSAGSDQVSAVATAFYRAVAADDGAAACALLAPRTREELEESAEAPCPAAIVDEDIPAAGAVLKLERFGNQAQVRFDADTAFLAEFAEGWRVVAVSCRPRADLPYDCRVEG